jgi:hypothetical protein
MPKQVVDDYLSATEVIACVEKPVKANLRAA